ncbi:hypothetical protein NQZ68_027691 [Dissostichus eleginoides]|nr:hypothetical protein NQZ68_027691 [Dissostichus eleginoides]
MRVTGKSIRDTSADSTLSQESSAKVQSGDRGFRYCTCDLQGNQQCCLSCLEEMQDLFVGGMIVGNCIQTRGNGEGDYASIGTGPVRCHGTSIVPPSTWAWHRNLQ